MATVNLDIPLDEIIKKNKHSARGGASRGGGRGGGAGRGRGRGRRRGRGGGGFVNGTDSSTANKTGSFLRARRPSAFQVAKSFVSRRPGGWGRGLLQDALGDALGIETSTKLFISNLDYGVSNEDIKELFTEIGELKHFGIHYDRSGRSIGTADVVFVRRSDAIVAMKRYNNVALDGKPMKIELIGTNFLPPPVRSGVYRGSGITRGRSSAPSRGGAARGRGSGFRRSRGRGRGRGRRPTAGDKKPPTLDDLDADLEKYHKEAMQTD